MDESNPTRGSLPECHVILYFFSHQCEETQNCMPLRAECPPLSEHVVLASATSGSSVRFSERLRVRILRPPHTCFAASTSTSPCAHCQRTRARAHLPDCREGQAVPGACQCLTRWKRFIGGRVYKWYKHFKKMPSNLKQCHWLPTASCQAAFLNLNISSIHLDLVFTHGLFLKYMSGN